MSLIKWLLCTKCNKPEMVEYPHVWGCLSCGHTVNKQQQDQTSGE